MPTRMQHHLIWPPLLAAASLARDVARIRSRPHPCGNMATLAPRRAARAHRAAAAHTPLACVQRRDFAQPAAARRGTGAGRDRVACAREVRRLRLSGPRTRAASTELGGHRADLVACAWPAPAPGWHWARVLRRFLHTCHVPSKPRAGGRRGVRAPASLET